MRRPEGASLGGQRAAGRVGGGRRAAGTCDTTVTAPVARSKRNTSGVERASSWPATRFGASERNATKAPSDLIDGKSLVPAAVVVALAAECATSVSAPVARSAGEDITGVIVVTLAADQVGGHRHKGHQRAVGADRGTATPAGRGDGHTATGAPRHQPHRSGRPLSWAAAPATVSDLSYLSGLS